MKKYEKIPVGYLMVLRQGDDVIQQLDELARKEAIPSASFSGMGFVDATFGFFDFKTSKYNPKHFTGVEMASMQGSIAWKKGEPSVHAHGVVTDNSFQAFGGHLLGAIVSTGSLEILITVHDKPFERIHDEELGADVLNLGN